MKGSPLLSTIIALLLMAGAYLWLDFSLKTSESVTPIVKSNNELSSPSPMTNEIIPSYIEAHFSTQPTSFKITDPLSGKVISNISNLTGNEWTGEIDIPIGTTAELRVQATWKQTTANSTAQQNFIQLILSPDQMDDSTVTLRNSGEIDTTAIFQLRN